MINFDDVEGWEPSLSMALRECVPASVRSQVRAATPKYVEDARDLMLRLADRDSVFDAMIGWITLSTLSGYHGSRLSDDEVSSIRAVGLVPLTADSRRRRLERALRSHPRWNEVKSELDSALIAHGPRMRAGRRENQVHLTLSRRGLTHGFNHYLKYGSEFDQHVAYSFFEEHGYDLLQRDGKPFLIEVSVPGSRALDSAHRHFSLAETRAMGEIPNILKQFLDVWSYRIAHPHFQASSLKVDCGMVFSEPVPAEWITSVTHVPEPE